jgi:DNA-directed RNA polymerase specialized sigma24 family protein
MAEPMNDLSAFDGDAERERQICDLRVKGKSEAEVCQMLGVTVSDIHRALDRAAQAAMNGARPIGVRSELLDRL